MGKKVSFIKHLADIMSQNKMLLEEKDRLNKEVEKLTIQVEKYQNLLNKENKRDNVKSKDTRKNQITKYKTSTVLFADTQGFQNISKDMDSKILVDNLDEIFIELESIIKRTNLIQIKSIEDTIMCVGGIPEKNITNPLEVVLVAIDMQYHLKELQRSYSGNKFWQLRIGIHTGPIVAHNVGNSRKNNLKITGDTVNLATRIRSFCREGEILISETTYEMVNDMIHCEYFGKMPVKYKGNIQLYSVKGIKPEYSLKGRGIIPNKRFNIRFGLAQFTDLEELVLDKLEKELSPDLYYHNVKHTVDVVTQVELIGLGEDVTNEEILLLKTAALFHDAGHIVGYDNHEYYGSVMARDILPNYHYSHSQIDRICELIMATKQPPRPTNKLEEIMCDADLDYLGRSDMIPVSHALFKELKEKDKINSIEQWNKLQIKFISQHQYYTPTARSLREVNKLNQIERIKNLIVEV